MRVVFNVKTKQGDIDSVKYDSNSNPFKMDGEAITVMLNSDTVRFNYNGRIIMTRITGKMYDFISNAFNIDIEEI